MGGLAGWAIGGWLGAIGGGITLFGGVGVVLVVTDDNTGS
jgi:hypothetical protein